MRFLFLFAALLSMSAIARAQTIANSPGWKLEKIENEESNSPEGVVFEYADYFALYPNDTRGPITIDGATATRLLSGQMTAESVYYARTMGAVASAKQNDSSAAGGAVGWQIAESTYVPLGQENQNGRGPASANNYNLPGNTPTPGAADATPRGGAAMAAHAGYAAASPAANAGSAAAANEVTIGNSLSGSMSATRPGYKPAPTPASGETGSGNQTYSQMIDSAMGQASQSLCGRMGGFAAAGQCK